MASKTFHVRSRDGTCQAVDFEDISSLTITKSVGVGGVNLAADVRTIQQALNQVPADSGGPDPALAVDGFIGPKTNAAIADFQQQSFGWSDGRVDTDNVTIAKLREFTDGTDTSGTTSAAAKTNPHHHETVSAAPCTDPQDSALIMGEVFDSVPEALRWIFSAQVALDQARDDLVLPNVVRPFNIIGGRGTKLVNKYFHLDKLPKARAVAEIGRMHRLFTTMNAAIGHNSQSPNKDAGRSAGFLQPDPCCVNSKLKSIQNAFAYTFFGGFTAKNAKSGKPRLSREDNYAGPNLREDTIFFCTAALLDSEEFDQELFAVTLVHELAHFCGPEKGHGKITDHTPHGDEDDVTTLSVSLALHNAESYAQFAGEAALGREVIQ